DLQRGIELSARVKANGLRLTVDFFNNRLELGVQRVTVAGERTRSRLRGESAAAIEQQRNVVQTAVDSLQRRQTVSSVSHALLQHGNVGAEAVGDGQARGVIGGGVNAQTRGQALNRA